MATTPASWPRRSVIGHGCRVVYAVSRPPIQPEREEGSVPAPADAHDVLSAFRVDSAQAMLKRLRQDSYTELVALAVQTAPSHSRQSMKVIRKAINRRKLTPATPN
jgi:hypothetical protein